MTNIYSGYGNSPCISTMFDSSKGSFGNRFDCTVHRAANTVRTTVETAALGAATYAGYKAINYASKGKCFNWNPAINKGLTNLSSTFKNVSTKIAKNASNLSGVKKYLAKGAKGIVEVMKTGCEKLAKTTGKQKLLGALGLVALSTLIAIERKHAFNEGKYEQEYNYRADKQNNV